MIANSTGRAANYCAPPFITANSIAEKLNWVPSLQRRFQQHVQSHPVQGWAVHDTDLYVSIFKLLCLPGGLVFFEELVAGFDTKHRGLLNALTDAGVRQLPTGMKRPKSFTGLMSTMVCQGAWDLAAWMAWSQLEIQSRKGEFDCSTRVNELINGHEEVALRLGDYWTDGGWLRELGDQAKSPCPHAPADAPSELAFIELRWRDEINALIQRLSDATIDKDISHEIAVAGERLGSLCQQWDEIGVASFRTRCGVALTALGDALCAVDPPLSVGHHSAEGFIEALAQDLSRDFPKRVGEVEAAAKELQSLAEAVVVMADAESEAKALHAREDTDLADAAYAMARSRRRNVSCCRFG